MVGLPNESTLPVLNEDGQEETKPVESIVEQKTETNPKDVIEMIIESINSIGERITAIESALFRIKGAI